MASRLFDAAQKGDVEKLKHLIETCGIDVNSVDKNHSTALHLACDWNHIECVRYLLQSNADTTIADNHGRTAMYFAARDGSNKPEIVELLNSGTSVRVAPSKAPPKNTTVKRKESPVISDDVIVEKKTALEVVPAVETKKVVTTVYKKQVKAESPSAVAPKEIGRKGNYKVNLEKLPESDWDLIECGIFTSSEKHLFRKHIRGATLHLTDLGYEINARYFVHPETTGTVIMMHGFGKSSSWATWTKFVDPLFENCKKNIIMIDFPGFGNSSGRTIQTRTWKGHAHELLKGVLEAMEVKGPVTVIAVCGGAATTFRTITHYPQLFANRHMFHNCVISEWPVEMEKVLKSTGTKCLITWCPDPDHSKMCVSYKRLSLLRRQGYKNIVFEDIADQVMFRPHIPLEHNMTKSESKRVSVFTPQWSHIQRVIKFLFNVDLPERKDYDSETMSIISSHISSQESEIEEFDVDDMAAIDDIPLDDTAIDEEDQPDEQTDFC